MMIKLKGKQYKKIVSIPVVRNGSSIVSYLDIAKYLYDTQSCLVTSNDYVIIGEDTGVGMPVLQCYHIHDEETNHE
jgi:hypothetical protein